MKYRRKHVEKSLRKTEKSDDFISMKDLIPRSFAEQKLKICPICHAEGPSWTVSSTWALLDNYHHFKCSKCNSLFKISESDITGLSFTSNTFVGQMKKIHKKKSTDIYVCIEQVGSHLADFPNLIGLEAPLDEIRALTKNINIVKGD